MQRDRACSFSALRGTGSALRGLSNVDPKREITSKTWDRQTPLVLPMVCPTSHRVLPSASPLLALFLQAVREDLNRRWSDSPRSALLSADVCSNNGQLFQNKTVCISQVGYTALGSLGFDRKVMLPSLSWLVATSFSLALDLSQAPTATISSSSS